MNHETQFRNFLALVIGSLLLTAGAAHGVVSGQCVQARGGNSCTAGDVTFILVGLGTQNDGCVNNTTDTLNILLGGQLQNTAADTRYDIGMYIYNFLGTETQPAVSQGYAYNGTSCAREMLKPAGTLNDLRCTFDSPAGSLNLLGGSGRYYNADSDSCSDLRKVQTSTTCDANADGKWDDSFMVFSDPITLKCFDGTNGTADGFVDIPTCATWGQNANDIGTGGVCSSETDVLPGTPSKCNCQTVNSTVPAPNLSMSCSCSPNPVRVGASNGASTTCTVNLTNNVSCTPSSTTAERFRCGAASYLQFDTTAALSGGSGSLGTSQFLDSPNVTPTETTGGRTDVATESGVNLVRWTPRDTVATGGGTELGVIGHNETGSMTFQYFVDPTVPSNRTITFNTTAYWSNTNTLGTNDIFSSRTAQSALTASCSVTTDVNATWAHVSSFTAREDNGRVVAEWETAGEVGTVAFEVERKDPASGRFVKISEQAVPAVAQLPGGRYRLVDAMAPRGQKLTYRLIEIDQHGKREIFGPYRVSVQAEGRRPSKDDRDFTAQAKAVSPRLLMIKGAAEKAARAGTPTAASRAKIEVSGSGMVRVTTQALATALGLSTGEAATQIRTGKLQLTHGGQNVAWEAAADGAGLLFYAEAIQSPYTNTNVYWLEGGKGQLVTALTARPASGPAAGEFADVLHLETDAIPAVTAPLPVEDFWIWKNFFPGFPGFDYGNFAANVPAPGTGGATLAVQIYGFSPVQSASLKVNGSAIGEVVWEGTGPRTATASVPAGLLLDGNNQIEIQALTGGFGFWFDSFDLSYSHRYRAVSDRLTFRAEADSAVALSGFQSSAIAVYDVAQPLAPRRLSGLAAQPQPDGSWGVSFFAPGSGPFVALTPSALGGAAVRASAPADLRNPSRGAEYLVITPDALNGESQRLAGLRAAQGLSTMVVDLDDVMDLFNDGIYSPLAIRSFLAHATASWPTRPRYVALAGKGTYDYRNLLGLSSNLLPTLLVTTDDGLAPADAQFADFDGNGVPEVAIGRIPAVTAEEMRGYVDKLAAYESGAGGSWTGKALFVADNPDGAGNFPEVSEGLAQGLGSGLALSRVYLPPGAGSEQVQTSRAELQDALRGGQVLMNYIGHGGLDRLETEGVLLTEDVPLLGNAPRLPVMTALTCLISQFAYPDYSSLGEELVLQRDGGTAALFGPTWLSYNSSAGDLGRYLLPQLSATGGGRLGDRVLRGLAGYAAAGGDRQTLRVYTLLGDPALAIKR